MPPAFVLSQDQTLRLIAPHQQPSLAAQPPPPSTNKRKPVTFDWRNLPAPPGRPTHQATPSDATSEAQIGPKAKPPPTPSAPPNTPKKPPTTPTHLPTQKT